MILDQSDILTKFTRLSKGKFKLNLLEIMFYSIFKTFHEGKLALELKVEFVDDY
jgi:hypothetical protein